MMFLYLLNLNAVRIVRHCRDSYLPTEGAVRFQIVTLAPSSGRTGGVHLFQFKKALTEIFPGLFQLLESVYFTCKMIH